MGLNVSKGNMYEFITHTWNAVKGECYHDCSYCYMKRWGKLNPVRLDEKELKTDLGTDNFIFVGSSCDMWAKEIPEQWIRIILKHMEQFDNKYLLQSKNPARILDFIDATVITDKCVVCTTIESNRILFEYQADSPVVYKRVSAMRELSGIIDTYVTIEPIMDFDINYLVQMIEFCNPKQVNIGADTGKHNLPEPEPYKLHSLIDKLERFTTVHLKPNLRRLL